jgi:hypothetical protein
VRLTLAEGQGRGMEGLTVDGADLLIQILAVDGLAGWNVCHSGTPGKLLWLQKRTRKASLRDQESKG